MNQKSDSISASFVWKAMEKFSVQGVSFILSVVLARLLLPEDYGLIALITIFISLATTFVQGGFNTALIQKKGADDKDYSSVLYFSLGIALLLYIVLFCVAPLIAYFYNEPELKNIVRIFAFTLFPGAFNSVQIAYCSVRMQFKRIFKCNLSAVLVSAILGIIIAILGGGAWALVCQYISKEITVCIIMLRYSEWRPKKLFSLERLKGLVSFGSKILASNLLVTFFLNIRSLIIGKIYNSSALAYFNRGKTFPQLIMDCVSGTIQSVLLPTYSARQDNLDEIKKMVRQSVRISCYLIFPAMLGLAVVADDLICFLLTEKWLASVPYLQIFCISYMFQPMQLAPEQAIRAIGRSDINLKIELCRKTSEITFLIISIKFGVIAIAISSIFAGLAAYIFVMRPSAKYLQYKISEQVMDIFSALILSIIMVLGIEVFSQVINITNVFARLFGKAIFGVVLYVVVSFLSKNKEFIFLINLITKRIKSN